ncbi:MAG: Murein DD-endopeptidase MepH [Pseudomonas citronellolis]|nr:MAG: Murein DD-endopeptidase MepH [Pseudomonas citronellolis]
MAMMTRFAFLSLVALLAACSSRAPAPAPVAKPQITFIDQPSSSPVADDVLIRAIGLVGTPYRWGGNTPDSGFDCSGLIGYVYRDAANINLPRSTREMIVMRAPTVDINSLQSGDLVFFATGGGSQVSHAGIYVGEGRFVHAPSTGGTVRLDYLSNSHWSKAYLQAKRVLAPGHLAQNP